MNEWPPSVFSVCLFISQRAVLLILHTLIGTIDDCTRLVGSFHFIFTFLIFTTIITSRITTMNLLQIFFFSFSILTLDLVCWWSPTSSLVSAQRDTIFSKGGTCLYKIRKQYDACMETQNARLIRDRDALEPIYTHAAMIRSTNRISCCAFWSFLDCVYEAADEHCPGDRRDMEAYVIQLGSAVPAQDCLELFPRDSPDCEGLGGGASAAVAALSFSIFSLLSSLLVASMFLLVAVL